MAPIIKVNVSLVNYEFLTEQCVNWTKAHESRYVCAANVHMLMVAFDSSEFRQMINRADMVVPDGMPLVWLMRLKGHKHQQRVYGPTLMLRLLKASADENIAVGFYGGSSEVLDSLTARMKSLFPNLKVAYSFSPPFREMNRMEDAEVVKQINASSVRILFVGLGCPKQEVWMARHRGKVNAVMLGVGAAFDFHAGFKSQAPAWMQLIGLEWLFRLGAEPRRLWRRYLYHNPRFVILAVLDLLGIIR
jgi:N-acetylglucosaminyldiphosphoundecaprenol N-acetyl-beta-D-mannosaminyltransferase